MTLSTDVDERRPSIVVDLLDDATSEDFDSSSVGDFDSRKNSTDLASKACTFMTKVGACGGFRLDPS